MAKLNSREIKIKEKLDNKMIIIINYVLFAKIW